MSELNHLDTDSYLAFSGILISTALHGISLAQTAFYFTHYKDHRALYILVVILRILDTANQCLQVALAWAIFSEGHMQPDLFISFSHYMRLIAMDYFLTVVVIGMVQSFYLQNMWKLLQSSQWRMPLLILGSMSALIGIVFGLQLVPQMWHRSNMMTFLSTTSTLYTMSIQLTGLVITDVFIMTTLCCTFNGFKTGFRSTNSMLSKLMSLTLQRGILMCAAEIGILVAFVRDHLYGSHSFCLLYFPLGTVYANTLLASLNARNYLRNAGNTTSRGSAIIM